MTIDMTGTPRRVALVTCAALPELDPDDRLVLEPLTAAGVSVDAVRWDDQGVDWGRYGVVVIRSTWDYPGRRDEFVAWAATVPRLANPARVVAWNTDKRYLDELPAAGVPVVATTWVAPGQPWRPPGAGDWVIKPAVGAGSKDSGRYDLTTAAHRDLAAAHVARLGATGRVAMVQPYLAAVDTAGETSLIFLDGEFSHAIRKGPMLRGPDTATPGLYEPEEITPRTPTPAEQAAARKALAAVPGPLLYARVDLVAGPDGDPVLMELELTEPSLFLGTAQGAADRFARAIRRAMTDPDRGA